MCVRFDDSLRTVLAADTTSAFGAQSAFRQLVDLVGRRRVDDVGPPIERLRVLRPQVPASVRAASARALALGDPPAALVAFFAEDEPAVAAPVLRIASLTEEEWLALLPKLGPAGRALLRRRDAGLPAAAIRGLAAFGATDFTLSHDTPARELDAAVAEPSPSPAPAPAPLSPDDAEPSSAGQTFAIAELVERIETFQRVRERPEPADAPISDRFSFETDASRLICWVDGAPRAGLVGRKLDLVGFPVPNRVLTTTLRIGHRGPAAGDWDVAAVPLFAPDTGRFAGFRGVARRASRAEDRSAIEPEALRRLVHELRTPTVAIAGFAELIATELLGPTPEPHRSRALAIGRDVTALIGAIDDLEMSARIDGDALDLAPRPVDLDAALAAAVDRADGGDRLRLAAPTGLSVLADDRALDRLLVRLAETAAAAGELATSAVRVEHGNVAIGWPWRRQAESTSLLGVDFSLRLAQRLAATLGGTLVIEPDRLTLHLPTSLNGEVQSTPH